MKISDTTRINKLSMITSHLIRERGDSHLQKFGTDQKKLENCQPAISTYMETYWYIIDQSSLVLEGRKVYEKMSIYSSQPTCWKYIIYLQNEKFETDTRQILASSSTRNLIITDNRYFANQ